ncbi:MAG: ATP-binding protein [Microcoleaceae cyanobacterium]
MIDLLLINPFTDELIELIDILQKAGYEMAIADRLDTALLKVEQLHPQLLICPQETETINGLELCKSLNDRADFISPCLIIIARDDDQSQLICQTNKYIDDSFSLPIEKAELLARIRLCLRTYQSNKKVWQMQNQLLKNEKVLSIGQMVSGIAHEINNPVSLITGNISHASEYTKDLLEVMQLYTEKYPDPDPEIQDLIEEIDLEFLTDDLLQVLNSMKTGADRIRQLVQSLRNFYQADDAEQRTIDIHTNIDDILLILKGRLKGKQGQPIEVISDYGELVSIECYPGQLNQVLMNLLNNAIDTLDILRLENAKFDPKIWIKTEFISADSQVKIRIKDNGTGIPEEIRDKIFDPFFTTKAAGQGTGFGLSISHTIVTKNHGGKIEYLSEVGKGSEFLIEIPTSQSVE